MYKKLTKAATQKLHGKSVLFRGRKDGEKFIDIDAVICVEDEDIYICTDNDNFDGSEAGERFGMSYSYKIFSDGDSQRTVNGDDNNIHDFEIDDLQPVPQSPIVTEDYIQEDKEQMIWHTIAGSHTEARIMKIYEGHTIQWLTSEGNVVLEGEFVAGVGTPHCFFLSDSDMYNGLKWFGRDVYKRKNSYVVETTHKIGHPKAVKIQILNKRLEILSKTKTKPTMKPEAKEVPNNGFNLTLPTAFVETYLREELGKKLPEAVDAFLQKNANKELEKIVKEEVDKLRPTQVTLNMEGKISSFTAKGKLHSSFREACKLAYIHKQIMLVGPAGSGKTTLSEQIAASMELPFHHISCSQGMSEAHITGRMLFDGAYVGSEFVNCYENGGVFLFDEIDAADANVLMIINSAIANGYLSIPNRKENTKALRHENFICIISGNTFGTGSVEYSGRGYLDAAFLDRFSMSKIFIDYDVSIEKDICEGKDDLLKFFHKLREIIKEKNLKRIVSTRTIKGAVMQRDGGFNDAEIAKRFVIDWSKEEKQMVKDYMPKEF